MDENLEGLLGSLGLSFVEEITDLWYEEKYGLLC